ncbi:MULTISPECIES: SGNH/GDSL hydrolase family protein [unclassified Nostoc]|uniref:SGNH/GDSL hydrolase family protein n=1 Tax=unclassified Nostoc TaxID=2593658 RepID=UPI002AD23ACE|nr:SGNH/GDSL hydrolase family protein [Nostoc sp. DedQUE03]MDZ7973503.1 SGNH/GDSL hydrolase family protein [Nostoc sp. DedQUE03]MDZ8047258.1 SGNH/GDSL hydrolase family protein [Nostoc sp. DedQUE02]
MKKFFRKYRIPIYITFTLIITEISLRLLLGLGNPVLSQADTYTGYRFQANQKIFRFGKRIEYNQYSQRSELITPEKPKGILRIMMIGDSVLNGGSPTDQQQIITELFKSKILATGHPVEVLNASAGSWGIGNQLGYLREFGTFESDVVVLEIGTNDLAQPTSTSAPVGNDPNFPTHRPLLAIQEAWTRYTWPRLLEIFKIDSAPSDFSLTPLSAEPDRQFQQNMQSLEAIVKLVRAQKIPIFVLFVPELSNLVPSNNPPKYKLEFIQQLKSLQVPLIDTEIQWSSLPKKKVETLFRDGIHPNEAGNQALANLLFQQLCVAGQLPACRENILR